MLVKRSDREWVLAECGEKDRVPAQSFADDECALGRLVKSEQSRNTVSDDVTLKEVGKTVERRTMRGTGSTYMNIAKARKRVSTQEEM